MKTKQKLLLETKIQEFIDEVSDEINIAPYDGWYPPSITERMADAAGAVFDGIMVGQEELKDLGYIKDT